MDKVLLETPEDEIDPQRLPIKDLILLAEYKERLAVHILHSNSCSCDDVILVAILVSFSLVVALPCYNYCVYAKFNFANLLWSSMTCPLMQSKEAETSKTPLTNLRYPFKHDLYVARPVELLFVFCIK